MFPHFTSRFPLRLLVGATLAGLVPSAPACGPDFPNAYLTFPGDTLAGLPTLSFPAELERLLGTPRPPAKTEATGNAAELAEIRALLETRVARNQVDRLVAAYRRDEPPRELPEEFQRYGRGARAWHEDRAVDAIAAWRSLLELPADQRRHRTVWAHYMIGRALWDQDSAAAIAEFQAARAAAAAGCTDSEQLAVASLGWEARIHLRQNEDARAIALYLQQFAAGGESAVASLQVTLQHAFREQPGTPDTQLAALAADPQLRGVVNAWFVARGGAFMPWTQAAAGQFRRWTAALPNAANLTAAECDRWAWAAYQNGLWAEAESFAQRAEPSAPASEWVRAMLLLRQGDLAGAAEHLAGASRAFAKDPALNSPWFSAEVGRNTTYEEDLPQTRLGGVRGVLALQREQYAEALRLFLEAGHWSDAAYVAEQVLTLPELESFTRTYAAGAAPAADGDDHHVAALRHLLARRLVRAARFEEAREFFPASLQATFDRYVACVRDGYRHDLAPRLRALALWEGAQTLRQSGLELEGTELAPDFSIHGGNFEWPDIRDARGIRDETTSWLDHRSDAITGLTAPAAEQDRVLGMKLPSRRFHYRHHAAKLAFLAATLLPDNDDLTARILNSSGRWIAARTPEDADIFYKTLVFRCAETELGRRAAERHWFVPPGT